jgi:flagellar protein FlaJ
MISLKSLPRLKGKASSKENRIQADGQPVEKIKFNSDLLKGDLFCQLTYMSALATSQLNRAQLFEYASRLSFSSSVYFRQIHFMAKKLNYDYSEACRMVGEKTKEALPKSFLLRMSGAIASGEDVAEFLKREAYVIGENYGEEYERNVESLKRWTDAYTALIISASIVVVISVVSMLIFPMSPTSISLLTFVMLISVLLGVWILYRSSPKELKSHHLAQTSAAQTLARKVLLYVSVPLFIVSIPVLLFMQAGMGWSMIVIALLMMPAGILIMYDDRQIDKNDADIAGFLRSLGGISKVIGTTVTEAITRLDFGSLGSLKKPVIRLNTALKFGIRPDLCWQKFVCETGSEQINRSVRIFWDGIVVGGDSQKVGNQASMFAMKIGMLREKRKMVSSGFSFLCIAMHATMAVLLVGIYQIMWNFSQAMQKMSVTGGEGMQAISQLPTFAFFADSSGPLTVLNMMVTSMLIMLTITNPAALKFVEGGHSYKYIFYLAIIMLISGASFVLVPDLVKGMFGTLPVGGK